MQCIRLKGKLGRGEPHLRLDDEGLWLVDAIEAPEVRIDVLAAEPLRYEERRLGDRLVVGEHVIGVPTGRGAEVQTLIGVARLRKGSLPTIDIFAPFVEGVGERDRAWLSAWLEEGEELLAWLATASAVEVPGGIGPDVTVEQRFVLTDRRAALVAVGSLGDVVVRPLDGPLIVTRAIGRDRVECGGQRWVTSLSNEEAYLALEPAVVSRADRVHRFAHACWAKSGGKGPAAARARALLAGARDPWAALTLAALDGATSGDDELRAVADHPEASERLVAWATRWEVADDALEATIARFRELNLLRAAGALHEVRWSRSVAADRDLLRSAELDIEHAAALVAAERAEEAIGVLEGCLARLPGSGLLELVSDGEGGKAHGLRVEALERLATLRGGERGDAATLAELAQLAPLVPERLSRLAESAEGRLAARARRVLEVLAPGGLRAAPLGESGDASPAPPRSLSDAQIERLRHPEARGGGALGKLQALLADVEVPDHGALKSFCERLHGQQHPAAERAITRAVVMLGARGVEGFLSRGDKTIGVRAYEGEPSVLLVGVDHLDPASPHHMAAGELAFAIGSEVAHLRFGHARVTSSDVWRGALDKGRGTLEMVVAVMPALAAFRFTERLGSFAERLGDGPVAAVLETAGRWVGRGRPAPTGPSLDQGTEELVAAHRVTQFTADRAGLVIARDLGAALRAIFLSRPRYQAELGAVHELGLPAALLRRDASGELHHPDLAVRCGALIAFYLSDDYDRLTTDEGDAES